MESTELRAMLADTLHHERLATEAARRLASSYRPRTAGHGAMRLARALPTGALLVVASLIRSLVS